MNEIKITRKIMPWMWVVISSAKLTKNKYIYMLLNFSKNNIMLTRQSNKKKTKKEYYHYSKVLMLQKFNFKGFLDQLDAGNILVDFDARTRHNHGSKFRMRQNCLPELYEKVTEII